jgi:NitT/TauT family transport system ATP-binding protein
MYREKAEALLAQVGLAGAGDRFPWELSGGMQMRASLCRALIHEPELLMLDEPFGALDAFTREELWCVIRDLHAASGVTVILVTHDLREAVFLADHVFVMSARPGRILEDRRIGLPRPRELDVTFTPAFQELVHELRGHIVKARP